MASALKAIFTADATNFHKNLQAIVAATDKAEKDIEAASRRNRARALLRERAELNAARRQRVMDQISEGSVPESWMPAKAAQKQMQEARMRINAGWLQIIHSARATVDSLATGANPLTVLLQQVPQVAQGLILVGGRLAALAGLAGVAALATVGLGVGINKVVNAFYDVDNVAGRNLEKARLFWRQARLEAEAYRAELEKQKQAYKETLNAYMSADERLGKLRQENAEKNAPDEETRHKIAIGDRERELNLAQIAYDQVKGQKFSPDRAVAQKAIEAEIKLEQAKQAVIDENRKHAEATQKNTPEAARAMVHGTVNALQQIGAYTSPAAVSQLDVARRSLAHLANIDRKLSGGGTHRLPPMGATKY